MTVTLESLSDSRNTLARLCLLAVRAADKTWKGVDPRRVRDSWNRTNVDFITLFAALQTRAASDAMDSSTLMLAEQDDYVRPDGIANPMAFGTGFAPSGIDLESYFSIPVTRTLQAIKSGVGESDAMADRTRDAPPDEHSGLGRHVRQCDGRQHHPKSWRRLRARRIARLLSTLRHTRRKILPA